MANLSLLESIAYIYDKDDNMLKATKVISVDKKNAEIEIEGDAQIAKGETCKVLVMSSDHPRAFAGRIMSFSALSTTIVIGSGKDISHFKLELFNPSTPTFITSLVYDDYAYTLYKPFSVGLIDLGQRRLRFSAPNNSLVTGCRFEICFKIGGKEKIILAEVVNEQPKANMNSEYSCKYYSNDKPLQRVVI